MCRQRARPNAGLLFLSLDAILAAHSSGVLIVINSCQGGRMVRNLCPPAFTAATLCLLVGASAPPARACAFDGGASAGLFDGGFEALYPKSSTVYFAIVDAVDHGILEKSAVQPGTPRRSGDVPVAARLSR